MKKSNIGPIKLLKWDTFQSVSLNNQIIIFIRCYQKGNIDGVLIQDVALYTRKSAKPHFKMLSVRK